MATEKRSYDVYAESVTVPLNLARSYAVYAEVVVSDQLAVTDMWQVHLITGAG